jgi:uncharacterized RDD family membrane protein YckC
MKSWVTLPATLEEFMAPDTFTSHATHRMLELEGLKLAPFGRRLLAFGFDFFFTAALFTCLAIGGAKLAAMAHLLRDGAKVDLQFDFHHWYSLLSLVVYFGLATYLGNGQTLGKRLARIRVVSTLHPKLAFWHSLERALGYGASALELGFGFLQYFIAENRQTAHDRLAGTIVISEPPKALTPP